MWKSKAWKWLIIGSAMTVIVMYMLEMTSQGIKRVYGPLEHATANHVNAEEVEPAKGLLLREQAASYEELELLRSQQPLQMKASNDQKATGSSIDAEIIVLEAEIAELKKLALLKEKQELQQKLLINEQDNKPAVNKVADSTSEVLQNASSSGLQFIATMFSKVID